MRQSKNRRAVTRTVKLRVSSDNTCPDPRTAKLPIKSRRRNFLAGSAFTGGVFALMMAANPQSASAACVINNSTGGAGTIECSGTYATSNSTNPITGTKTNASSSVRDQSFNDAFSVGAGASGYTIDPGTAITGYGLSIDSTVSNAPVTIINSGNVSVTTGSGTLAGANPSLNASGAALNINGDGGTITYTGNGNGNGGSAGIYDGIDIVNTGPGAVIVGGNGTTAFPGNPVTPTLTGANGLGISTVNGDQNVFIQNGTISVTSADGNGIFQSAMTGKVNLTITGGTTISSTVASSGIFGIEAVTSGTGSVSVASSATMGAPLTPFTDGIDAASDVSVGGNTTVVQTGGIIYATSTGIHASGAGAVAVTTNLGSQIAMGTGDTPSGTAISANSSHNSVTVTVNGLIDEPVDGVFATGAGDVTVTQNTPNLVTTDAGVIAESFGAGNVTVSGTGSIEGDGNKTGGGLYQGAIFALQEGVLGSVLVGGSGTTASANGVGIDAEISSLSNNGSVVVDRAGTVTAGLSGILASTSGGGNVTVSTGADVTAGNTSFGILAAQLGGNGDVAVTTGGAVTGGQGILAAAEGNGSVTVNSSAGLVSATATGISLVSTPLGTGAFLMSADGIDAFTENGAIGITTGAVTSADANGIEALSTDGTITIATHGPVSGNATTGFGILTDAADTTITTGNTTTGATGISALANNPAGSFVTINTTAGTVSGTDTAQETPQSGVGDGIFAETVNGPISITTGAVSSTANNGIEAQTGLTSGGNSPTLNGAITIVTNGNIDGGAGNTTQTQYGILAQQNDPTATSSGNIAI